MNQKIYFIRTLMLNLYQYFDLCKFTTTREYVIKMEEKQSVLLPVNLGFEFWLRIRLVIFEFISSDILH